VMHDMLGITQAFSPRFLRRYANLQETIVKSVGDYIKDVKDKDSPTMLNNIRSIEMLGNCVFGTFLGYLHAEIH
jgi:ketopantoate hydroxymethyltransferase